MPRWLPSSLVWVALSACGFALDGPDPNRPRNQAPECDTSKGAVVVDGLMATAMGVLTLSAVGSDEPAIGLLPLAVGAIYLGGALSGNKAVDRCRAAIADFGGDGSDSQERYGANDEEEQDDEQRSAQRQPPSRRPSHPPPTRGPSESPAPPPPPPAQQVSPVVPQVPAHAVQPPSGQRPAAPAVAPQPPSSPRPAPPPPPATDDWSEFWQEVP